MLRGPASLAVFSRGIRLTPLEAVIDGCSLPKTQRNQALVLLVISGPISKGTSFSRMLLLGPFRTTHSYFDNSVSICPTSVSYYKWTLSKHPQCMPNVRLLSSIVAEISLIQFSFVVLKGPSNCSHAVGPKEKYPEMNWRAADKVAAWKVFKRRMEVIFVADQIPEERQWALILVAGGDEAYNRWDTLEDTVQDRKKVEQVWQAFEKSFEQSTSFWHFRDTYLGDFRQDESETTADLDLRIKQTVKGCQWQKESEEERMIDLLYHTTIYYEIRKFVQESDRNALTYEMVIEKAKAHECNVLEYKDHQASHGGANSAPSYNNPLLSAHALSKRRPSGRGNNGQRCGKCGKSHERGNCPAYGKTCNRCQGINHFKAVCRSKVAAKTGQSPHRSKKSQPPRRGSTGSYNGQGKGGGKKKKTPKKPPKQNAYAVTMKNSVHQK